MNKRAITSYCTLDAVGFENRRVFEFYQYVRKPRYERCDRVTGAAHCLDEVKLRAVG